MEMESGDKDKDVANDTEALDAHSENQAGALHKEWALAKRIGKSEVAIFSAIGEVVKEPQKMNMWNQFQHFMVAEDSMNWKQRPGQSQDKFQAAIQKAYEEVLDLLEEDKDYYVEQLNDWYVKKMYEHTTED
ncbi:hypothetical protein GYMLUDRAFT_245678 [Collybiopsis luxurians FD-317 M1]|uniref:Uncharacterized protein n=1 Tax=Collybiopsis luxurians FD-317 M1 TaxID=944289 RepID=A0A0D0C8U5_9AGAR|nr:hypothetical protein GYMLUDRAFT_245678 [Collybiopsis luxurians FD-317 M1]